MSKMDVRKKIEVITQSYDVLVSTMPINSGRILQSLHSEEVITTTTLQQIRIEPLRRDKVMLLLDTVILRSLRVGMGDLYDKLADVLVESDDPVAKKLGNGLKEGRIEDDRPPPVKIEYNAKTASDAIRSMYVELTDGIPIKLLIPKLLARHVITQDDKDIIESEQLNPLHIHKTSYLLDEKIMRGLRLNITKPFEDFLQIMEECEDAIGNSLAHELKVKCGRITLPREVIISPEEDEVSDGLEAYLKDSAKEGSACYLASEPWIYAICLINIETVVKGERKYGKGSGFVGTLTIRGRTVTVLITNNHVFQTVEQARNATFQFGYHSHQDQSCQPNEIEGQMLIPENTLFFTNKCSDLKFDSLDYTVVEVNEQQLKKTTFCSKLDGIKHSIDDCKFDLDKHIQFSSAKPRDDRVVSIYHHPQGRTLKKSSQQSKNCDYLLFYLCDTEAGSSGSPIVKTTGDDHRYVIGLHRGYMKIGKTSYNYGSTMSAIVDHIHNKPPKYATSRDELVKLLR